MIILTIIIIVTQKILHRKSVQINNDTTWVKTGTDNFDITMGSFDSTQITDLVSMYILVTWNRIINLNNIAVYRDNGLSSIPNGNRLLTSKIRKKINRAFKYMGLKIVNFLDITFNLNDNPYKPFNKANTIPTYINDSYNHPTSIIKQIPNVININK